MQNEGSTPKASIIIRTFNEEKHIGNLLRAVAEQEMRDYEIILVDSGSTDRTMEIAKSQVDKVVPIASRDFTFGYALNAGCRQARGDFFVIISAHAYPIGTQWLGSLLTPFDDSKVAMVYGRHIGAESTKFSERRDFERYFGPAEGSKHPLPYFANNANSAIRASFWREYPFDEYLTGLEDIAWARQIREKGFKVVYAPAAVAYHIHDETWGHVYNRYRREAIAARRLGIPRPPFTTPSIHFFMQNLFGDLRASVGEISPVRLKDIFKFRWNQWQGTRQGWYRDRHIDIEHERGALYFSGANLGVVVSDKNTAYLKEVPIPEVKPSDVLIKVAYVGVCGTDLEVHAGTLGYYRDGIAKYPIVPGHEFSGQIVRLGANAQGKFNVGDRVVGECILSCGSCGHCERGSHTACAARREVGVMNYNGAYAKFIALPAYTMHKIPDGLDLKVACLAEPLAVVLRALRRAQGRMRSGSSCAVVGAGPIGNLAAQVLSYLGHHVTVFNRRFHRLRFLRGGLLTSQTLEKLDAFDVIVEASGNVEALEKVLAESRSDATIILLGFPYGNISYNFEDIVGKEKVVIGSVGGASQDFERALELLSRLDTAPFIQTILPLEQFAAAWDLHRSSQHLKILLQPSYEQG